MTALSIPVRVNLEQLKEGLKETSSLTNAATRQIAKQFYDANASIIATAGGIGRVAGATRAFIGVLGPLTAGLLAVKATFELMAFATDLAKQKIEEFNEIAAKAGKADLGTGMFQRMTKAGESLGLQLDDATKALDRFADTARDKLGGSDLQQRISQLAEAGNFKGNSGLSALAGATTTEQRLLAVIQLIEEAMQKGERLAALDIANKAFGPDIANRLRQNSGFLRDMLASADKIAAGKIISEEEIGRAIELKTRMEEAQKTLAEKFKPIQNDLAQLGVNYHQSWVEITETMASAVSIANRLYDALKGIPDLLAQAGSSSFWTKLTEATGRMGLNSKPEGLILRGEPGFADDPARARLAGVMRDPSAMRRAMQEATDAAMAVRGDRSKPPSTRGGSDDKLDTAIASIEKRTAALKSESQSLDLTAAARERNRVAAQLETVAMQINEEAGKGAGVVTAEQRKHIDAVAEAYGRATDAMERSQVASSIKFGRQTALLSPEDVAIAQQLKGLYPDVATALNSVEAQAMRTNEAMRGIGSTISNSLTSGLVDIVDGSKSVGDAFQSMSKVIIRAIEEAIVKLLIVQPLMRSLGSGLGFADGGIVPKFADGGVVSGPGGPRDDRVLARVSPGEFVVNAASTAKHRALLEQINRGPRFASGGIVGGADGSPPMIGSSTVIAPSISVQVQGHPGQSAADHVAMGDKVAKAAMNSIRKMIGDELRTQTKPGGQLYRR